MGYGEVMYGKEQMETSTNLCWGMLTKWSYSICSTDDTLSVIAVRPSKFYKVNAFVPDGKGRKVFPKMLSKEEPLNPLMLFTQPDIQDNHFMINSDFWHIQSCVN